MIVRIMTLAEYSAQFDLISQMSIDFVEQSGSSLRPSEILSRIYHAANNKTAFSVYDEHERLIGFVLCEIETFDGERTFSVVAAYNPAGGAAQQGGWKVLNQAAEEHGCTLISCEARFNSQGRVYYDKYLKPLGFVPAYVIYKKEVGDGIVEE